MKATLQSAYEKASIRYATTAATLGENDPMARHWLKLVQWIRQRICG